MSTRNLIDAIASGSALDIESAFEDTMAEKVSVQIEAKRLQIAQTMFTTEEVDLDEEQLNELGPETTVYINKATKDAHATIAAANAGGDKAMLQKRLDKRKSGLTKAMAKIVRKAKEEQEEQE
jgi:aspartate/tyrosine/aromatic aminotransferase